MTFAAREQSRNEGKPFHLYRFKIGPAATDILCYTNLTTAYEFTPPGGGAAETYLPLAIKHGDVVSSGNLDKSSLTVTSPDVSDLATLYKSEPPSYTITLVIFQGHRDDLDLKVCWAGRVLGGAFEETTLDLECEPIVASIRRPGLNRDFQYACPLVLYGNLCKASQAAATYVTAVTDVSGPLVTLPADWAPADRKAKCRGGIASWYNAAGRPERRSIVNYNADAIQISSFGTDLVVGTSLTIILGCNHLMDDCEDVHENILNFGGEPEIPLKNPIGLTRNFT